MEDAGDFGVLKNCEAQDLVHDNYGPYLVLVWTPIYADALTTP